MRHWENLLVELASILRRTELLTDSLSDGCDGPAFSVLREL
jgi:hypothetical protein